MAYKKMSNRLMKRIVDEVKMMLHASRDCMRNQGQNASKLTFSCKDAYYAETFGIMRGLALVKHGYLGSCNLDAVKEGKSTQPECNLRWWLQKIEEEVISNNFDEFDEKHQAQIGEFVDIVKMEV